MFERIFELAPSMMDANIEAFKYKLNVIELSCFLLFIGAMGKSAKLFIHTWIPDAMEGPTPVSALIHAATMVTAGVFMVCKLSPLFEGMLQMFLFYNINWSFNCFVCIYNCFNSI